MGDRGLLAGSARIFLALYVFALPVMQPNVAVRGLKATAADLLFLICLTAWGAALVSGQARLRWHPFFALLLVYFAALVLSTAYSVEPGGSMMKLASIAYLLAIPVIALSLVETQNDLRRIVLTWLAAGGLLAAYGIVSLALFYLSRETALLEHALFGFGSLPPGDYPRLRLTFVNANMLCHYLSIVVMLALIARRLAWLDRRIADPLLLALLPALVFTISPGLGSVALTVSLWFWWSDGSRRPRLSALIAGGGFAASLGFLLASAVSLAPRSAGSSMRLEAEAAPRLLTWTDSARTFVEDPLTGRGLGMGAADVDYVAPSGAHQHLTDAHNMFLNVAAESGLFALLALLLICGSLLRIAMPLGAPRTDADVLRIGLGLSLLGALIYQGLAGSFEDARHLWLLVGIFLAAVSLPPSGASGERPSCREP